MQGRARRVHCSMYAVFSVARPHHMKLESTQLRCKHINTYSKDKCEDIVTYKVSRKLARFD